MTTKSATAQPRLATVYRNSICIGFIMARRNGECEAFDFDNQSLGIFADPDAAGTVLVIPGTTGGGQVGFNYPQPLTVAAATNLTATTSAATSSIYCSAQGFVAN